MRSEEPGTHRHPLREPMVWLVWGLPALVVAASIATIWLAAGSGNADVVRDDVRRMAQVQTTGLERDERAATLGLSAVASIRQSDVRILPVSGIFPNGGPLRLVLAHPMRATQDRVIELEPDGHGWSTREPVDIGHDWNVELSSRQDGWRIVGRLRAGERAVRLGPALPGQ